MFNNFYQNKTVLITGHTGFKGSWLSHWLLKLGASVVGVALEPPTTPALFDLLHLNNRLEHHVVDIRDSEKITALVEKTQPDCLFHLAAQPLVLSGYTEPVATYETNLMGTLHVLEALRSLKKRCAAVCITTDKCYENREWVSGYREEDPMGGWDPYSSSKACCEIAISSYRRSFFNPSRPSTKVRLASARAGNVIGGGDWGENRLIPDYMRAWQANKPLPLRHPHAVRPWQHVLEPLSGYLELGCRLTEASGADLEKLCSAFNFGPLPDIFHSVASVVQIMSKTCPVPLEYAPSNASLPHEADLLCLAIDKAAHLLNWKPAWDFETTLEKTIAWYKRYYDAADGRGTLDAQAWVDEDIQAYTKALV